MPELHPDYRTNLGALPPFSFPGWSLRPVRLLSRTLKPPADRTGVDIIDTRTPSSLGHPVDVRIYLPAGTEGPLPVLVWFHGGGFMLGSHHDDGWGCHFARSAGIAVASSAYRLAPEHPFPAALEDAHTTARWAATGGYGHFSGQPVAVGGESAGGGLAATLAQRLHDEGVDVAAQLLVYPMVDDRTATRPDIGRNDHHVWSNGSNHLGWSSYLAGGPGADTVPQYAAAARREDLGGLPPTWIGVGTADLFVDEDLAYADRLRTAGVDVVTEVVEGAPHGFATLAPKAPGSVAFLESAGGFLTRHLG